MIRQPRLIHPCKFLVEPQSFIDSTFDDDLKEPIGKLSFSPAIKINGQMSYIEYYNYGKNDVVTHQGRDHDNKAYILFRYLDCDKLFWNPRIGDKISYFYVDTPREEHMNVYIVTIKPIIHRNGQPKMFKAYYADKNPAQQVQNNRFE